MNESDIVPVFHWNLH